MLRFIGPGERVGLGQVVPLPPTRSVYFFIHRALGFVHDAIYGMIDDPNWRSWTSTALPPVLTWRRLPSAIARIRQGRARLPESTGS